RVRLPLQGRVRAGEQPRAAARGERGEHDPDRRPRSLRAHPRGAAYPEHRVAAVQPGPAPRVGGAQRRGARSGCRRDRPAGPASGGAGTEGGGGGGLRGGGERRRAGGGDGGVGSAGGGAGMSAAPADTTALLQELEQFLYAEAELLDT